MTAAELKRILKTARDSGAATVKVDGVGEFSFGPKPKQAPPELDTSATEEQLKELMGGSMPSAEDLLYWSVPGPLPSEASAKQDDKE